MILIFYLLFLSLDVILLLLLNILSRHSCSPFLFPFHFCCIIICLRYKKFIICSKISPFTVMFIVSLPFSLPVIIVVTLAPCNIWIQIFGLSTTMTLIEIPTNVDDNSYIFIGYKNIQIKSQDYYTKITSYFMWIYIFSVCVIMSIESTHTFEISDKNFSYFSHPDVI